MKNILIFCGSGIGSDAIFSEQSKVLAHLLADHKCDLIYGGAKIGLMGVVAEEMLRRGRKAIGIIPTFLMKKEVVHEELTELIVVSSMHERKAKMLELADGIIALPGGFGTMEELFEVLTLAQLYRHQKPIGLLNIEGYYDDLLRLIDTMSRRQFLRPSHKEILISESDTSTLWKRMQEYRPSLDRKWF